MQIYLYTESGCSACVEAKAFLASRGILFEERNISGNNEYLRIMNEELDSCTTPTLVAGDEIIVGFDLRQYQLLQAGHVTHKDR